MNCLYCKQKITSDKYCTEIMTSRNPLIAHTHFYCGKICYRLYIDEKAYEKEPCGCE